MRINFNSIAIKAVGIIALFTMLLVFLGSFVLKNLFVDSYTNLEQEKVAIIADDIIDSVALNLSYGFMDAVEEIADKTLSKESILYVKIENYETFKSFIFSDANITLDEYRKNTDFIYENEFNDPATGTSLGKLTLVYSSKLFNSYIETFNSWFFLGILMFILASALLGNFLYKALEKLSLLDNSLKNFNPKSPKKLNIILTGRDEVSSITRSANIMIDNIILFLDKTRKLHEDILISQSHLKDAQRMAKVGSFEYNVSSNTLSLSDEYYRILAVNKNTKISWERFLSFIIGADYNRMQNMLDSAVLNGSDFELEYKLKINNNEEIYIRTKAKVRKKKGGDTKITAVSMDITQDIENQKTIENLAYYDALTGLANRTLLKDRMLKSIQRAKRLKEKVGVIFLDLDHFKLINDTLGHEVGDELLIYISQLLQKHIRSSDTVSRLGGDEFIILLPSIETLDSLKKLAEKIRKTLESKHMINSHELYLTSSIGVSFFPEHGETCDELIRNADTAMYEAKNNGRNNYVVYTESMGDFVDKRHYLEQDLTEAVKTQTQIEVFYQVKIDTFSRKIMGAEALVRWNHPDKGLVFPDDFIYMAESTGLMLELGAIVIEQSIEMITKISKLGFTNFTMAINLSARQFQDTHLVPLVSSLLKKYSVNPSQIEFEITESISMSNVTNTLRILEELKAFGVSIAIDDFGTGHSSLSYLKKFPIDTLKIDKSFVMDIIDDEEDRVIAQTVISMAHSLGLKTVAEGVETQEHIAMLHDMKCDVLQGYVYSKAISGDDFLEYITKGHL